MDTRYDALETTVKFLSQAKNIRELELILGLQEHTIGGMVSQLYATYSRRLSGTPEGEYLEALKRKYTGTTGFGTHKILLNLLDKTIKNTLQLPVRAKKTIYDTMGLEYLGELVQCSEIDLLRNRQFGRNSLEDVKKELSKLGLGLGMRVNYIPPEKR